MHPTPSRLLAGRSATFAVMLMMVSTAVAQNERVNAGVNATGSAVAQGSSLLGGALPGGAVLSSAVASLAPAKGGEILTCPLSDDGSFSFRGLKPGAYELRISFPAGPRQTTDTASSKQAQGAAPGGRLGAEGSAEGSTRAKHDTVKNSIGNIRAHGGSQAGGVNVAVGDVTGDGHGEVARGRIDAVQQKLDAKIEPASSSSRIDGNSMPNRISMNVTTPRKNFTLEAGGAPVVVSVGDDGTFAARASVQQQEAAQSSSSKGPPKGDLPPPRPAGG